MRVILICAILASLAVAGCQSTKIENAVAFDPSEAAFIRKDGRAAIEGHAFVTNSNGAVVNAAGQSVRLIPATAYARQRIAAIYGAAKFRQMALAPRLEADPDFLVYTRETKAESNGRFSFDKVAPGEYFVATQMSWKKPNNIFSEGALMYETVKITGAEKEPVKVIVSGQAIGL